MGVAVAVSPCLPVRHGPRCSACLSGRQVRSSLFANPVSYMLALLKKVFIEQKEEPAKRIFPAAMRCCGEKE